MKKFFDSPETHSGLSPVGVSGCKRLAQHVALVWLLVACANAPAPTTQPTTLPVTVAAPTSVVMLVPPLGPVLTITPALAATLLPTAIAQPTNTPQPTATPVPAVRFSQLTPAGCCVAPFFAPDGNQVMFLDRPAGETQTGIYAVVIDQPLSKPQFFNAHPGPYSRDMTLAVDLVGGQTQVRTADGSKRWNIPNGGRSLSFSPDNTRILWTVGEEFGGFDVRRNDVFLANPDGSGAQVIASRFGGGAQGWFDDNQRILLGGKAKREDKMSSFSILSLADRSVRTVVEVERARATSISPTGAWLAYTIAQSRDASQNGLYLMALSKDGAKPIKQDWFGASRWCSPDKLLVIPFEPGTPANSLWLIDASTGTRKTVIAPDAASPFKIGNGDWSLNLDNGRARILYVNARDTSIWLADLGDLCK